LSQTYAAPPNAGASEHSRRDSLTGSARVKGLLRFITL
jgi:hypothetical protein